MKITLIILPTFHKIELFFTRKAFRYHEKNAEIQIQKKIRRGPKLESCAFANFGNSSGTDGNRVMK